MTRRVLLTGAAGFVGHYMLKTIIDRTDWEVVCLDRLDYSGNLNRIKDVFLDMTHDQKSRVKFLWHDLKACINPTLTSQMGDIDTILHLAAASHVDRSITHPIDFLMDNTVGTVNLLEYARTLKDLKSFLYFSTDEIFGPAPPGVSYKERDRYNSTNPYSASKASAEEFCVAYRNTYDIPVMISHTMNIIGIRQTSEKFVPLCIRKILNKEKILIHADRSKTKPGSRHYIDATDVADAVLFLLNLNPVQQQLAMIPDYGGATCPKFNIVGKEEVDNLKLVTMIVSSMGIPADYEMVDFHTSRPGHDLRYSLNGSFMESLGWVPKTPIKQTIDHITKWYMDNREWLRGNS